MLANTTKSLGQTMDVLDALHCGAVLVDHDDVIVHANARFCRMMRLSPERLNRRCLWSFYACPDGAQLRDEFAHPENGAVERETYLSCASGERLPVIMSSRPLTRTAPLAGHRIFTVIDISQQKRAEARYHEQYQDIVQLSDTVLEQALDLRRYSHTLEEKIQERTAELHQANMDAILMLAVASEARDQDTGAHVLRIQRFADATARQLGLSNAESEIIGYSAILHDVGKMQVSDKILKKPGPLTPEERRAMEYHTIAGERILAKRSFFETARVIARSHHENWDGSGYPDRLAGERIALPARIVHLADVFDALTSPRVYKPAWPLPEAVAEIDRCTGVMFDPHVAKTFLTLVHDGAFAKTLAHRRPPRNTPPR